MTRIALLGTSHVAALWQGWQRIKADWPEFDLHCFAAPGRDGNAARLRGTRFGFFGPKAGAVKVFGHDEPSIDLEGFDHVVRNGRSFPEAELVPLLKAHAIDGIAADAEDRLPMSRAAGIEAIAAIACGALPPPEWRDWTAPTVTILQVPYPDTRFAAAKVPARQSAKQWLARRPAEMRAVREIYRAAFTTALAEHGIGFVPQPPETLGEDGLSLARYSAGSIRMADGAGHDTHDLLHMNADYGALAMGRLMEHLTGGRARTPARSASA